MSLNFKDSASTLYILYVVELKIISRCESIKGEPIYVRFVLNQSPQVHQLIHQKVATLKEGCHCEFSTTSKVLTNLVEFDSICFEPNENLSLRIELKNRFKLVDLSPEKDETILVSIIDGNDAWNTPSDLSKISLQYKAFDQNGVIIEDRKSALNPLQFTLDEKQAPEAIEIIVRHMTTTSWVYAILSGKYAFQTPNNNILANIEDPLKATHIHGMIISEYKRPREACELNINEKKQRGKQMISEGNKWFKLKEYQRAARRYQMGIEALEYLGGKSTEADILSCKDCLTQLRLNSSNSFLNQKMYIEAIQFTDDILKEDDQNHKAYFHKITALMKLNKYHDAENLCNKCVSNFPDQSLFRNLQNKINKLYEDDKNLKDMYQAFWR